MTWAAFGEYILKIKYKIVTNSVQSVTKKSLRLNNPPSLQSWFGGIYSKPHLIPCIQSPPYKPVHFSKAHYSIQCFLCLVSVPGLALCLRSVAVILYRTLLPFPSARPQFSVRFSIHTIADLKNKRLQINKAQHRWNRRGRPHQSDFNHNVDGMFLKWCLHLGRFFWMS